MSHDVFEEMRKQDRLRRQAMGLGTARGVLEEMHTQDRLKREALGLASHGVLGGAFDQASSLVRMATGMNTLGRPGGYDGVIGAAETARRLAENPGFLRMAEQSRVASLAIERATRGFSEYDRLYRAAIHPLSEMAKRLQKQQNELRGMFSGFTPDQLHTIRTATEAAWEMAQRYQGEEWNEIEIKEVDETPSSLVDILLRVLRQFGENNKQQLKNLTVFQIFTLISLLGTIRVFMADPAYTPHDRARDNLTAQHVEQLVELETGLQELAAVALQKAEYLDSLPKGMANAKARVRQSPTRNAPIIAALSEGDVIAFVENKGRWAKIIYFDPLSQHNREGWLWRASATPVEGGDPGSSANTTAN